MVELLLERGADWSAVDARGHSPFLLACVFSHVEVVKLLLARGVDPTARDASQRTCLMMVAGAPGANPASQSGHKAVLRLLLEDGRVPVDARDSEGATALWWSCQKGHTDRARALLVQGLADHTIADTQGVTPLEVAGRYKHGRGCQKLLQV